VEPKSFAVVGRKLFVQVLKAMGCGASAESKNEPESKAVAESKTDAESTTAVEKIADAVTGAAETAAGAAVTVVGATADVAATAAGATAGAVTEVASSAVSAAGSVVKMPGHLLGITRSPNVLEAKLGVMRLDYHYPPAPGDVDHPGSYDYNVEYKMVEGLTFEMCQNWEAARTEEVEERTKAALLHLKDKGASVIAGDCGFMMWLQKLGRNTVSLPVVLSSLASLPAISSAYSVDEQIAIFTANGKSLEPMRDLIKFECAIDPGSERFVFVGCEDVPGFEAVAEGKKVDLEKVTPGMVAKAQKVLADHPKVKAFLFECTELPPYSNAVRNATKLPVFDAITMCDLFIAGRLDNPRFGSTEWDEGLATKKSAFESAAGAALSAGTFMLKPVTMMADVAMSIVEASQERALSLMKRAEASGATLGVIRLDYHYPPAPGDIDHPGSYAYKVHYHMVKGFTFEMCQSGKMTEEVEAAFIEGIKALEALGASVITGDCGFMMWFQQLARRHTSLPVIMSSLASLPAICCAHSMQEQVAVFTANGKSLEPMRELIKVECGIDPEDTRFIFVGCEDVPGFEAVALGEKVDVEKVTPGIVAKAQKILADHPQVKNILLECTELPPYADALRHATGLPVFDAITTCDFFMTSRMENPKFGVEGY